MPFAGETHAPSRLLSNSAERILMNQFSSTLLLTGLTISLALAGCGGDDDDDDGGAGNAGTGGSSAGSGGKASGGKSGSAGKSAGGSGGSSGGGGESGASETGGASGSGGAPESGGASGAGGATDNAGAAGVGGVSDAGAGGSSGEFDAEQFCADLCDCVGKNSGDEAACDTNCPEVATTGTQQSCATALIDAEDGVEACVPVCDALPSE
jgi:hypothetical protein